MTSEELIFAEFGESRGNAGDAVLPKDRLEPSLSSFKRHFPEACCICYTDQGWEIPGVEVRYVNPPFDREHPRYGFRCNDYYQAVGLLASDAQIAVAVDSDLIVVSNKIGAIFPLAKAFGLCLPTNGRQFVYRDARSTCDGGPVLDSTEGMGMSLATGLWAFHTHDARARVLLEEYVAQMQSCPCRGPLALWRAQYAMGIQAYALPPQWLVTGNMPKLDDPIVLHAGHESVMSMYRELVEAGN